VNKNKFMSVCNICKNPNCSIIYQSNNEKLARYGFLKDPIEHDTDMNLNQTIYFCEECLFGWNEEFNYSNIRYDSDQIIEAGYFSKKYVEYQKNTAQYLGKLLNGQVDTIVEIGAGAGIFIDAFYAKNKIAIEPSDESRKINPDIKVYNEYFTPEKFKFPAEIVVLRQVLEHIKTPLNFLKEIEKSFGCGDNFHLYIEVPNSLLTFKNGRFYDFYYEHCNYFSSKTLEVMANELNMEIVESTSAMDGELISILLSKNKFCSDGVKEKLIENQKLIYEKIFNREGRGKRILAWGASGNGVQILNKLKIDKNIIEYVIDSDLNKQGKFIPGTLQKIISPEEAISICPDEILILTQFHKTEIKLMSEKLFPNANIWFAL
jgi:hypothetical protein